MQKSDDLTHVKLKYIFLIVIAAFAYKYAIIQWISITFNWEESNQVFLKSFGTTKVYIIWILFIPLMLYLKNRFPLSKENQTHKMLHIFLSILVSIFVEACSDLFENIFNYYYQPEKFPDIWDKYLSHFGLYMLNFGFINIAIYWMFIVYFSGVDYYKKYKDESLKRAEAESLIVKAELNALKMQIQPHFLFNTLHSISSLIDEDTEEAQDVVGRLGELLRYTLDQDQDFIPLKTELEFIGNYLEIEKIRFKDRLMIEYDIEDEANQILIASFILQPLIENAMKHGLAKTNEACTITIHAKVNANDLEIEIKDNGNGSKVIHKGIGLENTESRLKNYYESNFVFSYGNLDPHGFLVSMKIPVRKT